MDNSSQPTFDVFVSYRWMEPDQSWVRDRLCPALQASGLKVCLDVEDFVPGRDLILEMTRAGQSSRHALCVLSEHYFEGNRMVQFESLMARRLDPGGVDSKLVPFVLRRAVFPEWIRGLIPIDWSQKSERAREWRKLLKTLGAPDYSAPPEDDEPDQGSARPPIFIHDYNLPPQFIGRKIDLDVLATALVDRKAPHKMVAVTAIGGVGKSCLCRQLIEMPEVGRHFSRIVWFSFYEARAEAEDHFFSEILTFGFDALDSPRQVNGVKENTRMRRLLSDELDSKRTLLVLDGLEIIQHTEAPLAADYGTIKSTWSEVERLLKHILNGSISIALVTSRVPLRSFETTRGYLNHTLDAFAPKDGVHLLRALGVLGTDGAVEECAESLGGHALCLVAAGRYMARRRLAADKLQDLVGDTRLFSATAEGEKVTRICEWYRKELSKEQQYFLSRLALHGRAVTRANYPVLVEGYGGISSDRDLEEKIVEPLVDRGLIDCLESADDVKRYSAHPLMKLAFSTWLEPEERKRAHEVWAKAATSRPGTFISDAMSIEELEPFVEAAEQYVAADNWREAWNIYAHHNLGQRLGYLGYVDRAFSLGLQFERAQPEMRDWDAENSIDLYWLLAWLASRLGKNEEVGYHRKQIEIARSARVSNLAAVKARVASSLAISGFVREAVALRSTQRRARGIIALAQGQYEQAIKLLSKTFSGTVDHERTSLSQPLGEALIRSGKISEGMKVLNEGLRVAIEKKFTCCQHDILDLLIAAAVRRDDLGEARRLANARNELRTHFGLSKHEHFVLRLSEGDVDGAFSSLELLQQQSPSVLISVHMGRARIFLRLKEFDKASAELELATKIRWASGCAQFNDDMISCQRLLRQIHNTNGEPVPTPPQSRQSTP